MLVIFGLVPILDNLIGKDKWNPSCKEEERELESRMTFRYVTYIWPFIHLTNVLMASYCVANHELTPLQAFSLWVGAGLNGAQGINVSHELIHKPTAIEQFLGKSILVIVNYGHWYVEHLFGHHKRVATSEDCATSRYNENVYSFVVRSEITSFFSAWELEKQRLLKKNKPVFSVYNQIIVMQALSMALAGAIYYFMGTIAMVFYFLQGWLGATFLEIVNYVEHYGLERKKRPDGQYESVKFHHSWNAGERLTNYLLFKLQRHSHHHQSAGVRYQCLKNIEKAPQLPYGYATMILISLYPPLFFRMMNPLCDKANRGDFSVM
eukprot:Nk52_evm53s1020 gene=Nk52_evmTU53s1020